jgi:hypothetical protein
LLWLWLLLFLILIIFFHFHNYATKEVFELWTSRERERERELDLWENRFSTKLDRKLTDPIHQKAARTCYRNLWPQHFTSPPSQEREKNKKLNFFFLDEESIKTNPTQQKFNLTKLKTKIFTAKCGSKL